MEDSDGLRPIDFLSENSDRLEKRFMEFEDNQEAQDELICNYLDDWPAEQGLSVLDEMKIEFEPDLEWFNVTQPLTMEDLNGKVVILDFFTYCCINCMHILPDLHDLEEMYPPDRGLVIIGVHTPKFDNEKSDSNIVAATKRYNITHPIVNDAQSTLWRQLGIQCWPTLIVCSPNGLPILLLMGEGHGFFLKRFIGEALRFYEDADDISDSSLPIVHSTEPLPASNLRFPAKMARSDRGLYALADAGNNRVLVIDSMGNVLHKVGGTESGYADGDFATARFNAPHGVVFFNNDTIVVADTKNHLLREISISNDRVITLAGTRWQGTDREGGNLGNVQPISSPWDVAVYRTRDMDMSFHIDDQSVEEKPIVLVAMAGLHQIWAYFPEGMIWWKYRKFEPCTCNALVGNGAEENRNNSYPQNAAFAQPSGLAVGDNFLFVADSESSSIRKVSLIDGKVMPVVGGDRDPLNLFAYGDVDGKLFSAKLQHPLGVAYNHISEKVYIADTYNHKIKMVDPIASTIESLVVYNEQGALHRFSEPASVCVDTSGEFLFVSDTNNHNIQYVNLQTMVTKTFHLNFNYAPMPSELDIIPSCKYLWHSLPLRSYKELLLHVLFVFDAGMKFNAEAPQKWTLTTTETALVAPYTTGTLNVDGKLVIEFKRLPTTQTFLRESLTLEFCLALCNDNSCLMKRFAILINDDINSAYLPSMSAVGETITIKLSSKNVVICD
ncbi:NHL repeat-containing protein 2 [Teleopsis dalmanni]|uniref:NHL repeat-containing protein 2 n=1 Tax=Teleopsis dalmanni TaxID=139649 RepID=UPI0018CD4623|nr:NHL repeat-containing protein 2 [Teleopsis dalmanni]XP_037958620.1 NHL repeat-containing protein 2 [Teleopsis dalmanni]